MPKAGPDLSCSSHSSVQTLEEFKRAAEAEAQQQRALSVAWPQGQHRSKAHRKARRRIAGCCDKLLWKPLFWSQSQGTPCVSLVRQLVSLVVKMLGPKPAALWV